MDNIKSAEGDEPAILKELIELAEDGYKLHIRNACHQEFLSEDVEVLSKGKKLLKRLQSLPSNVKEDEAKWEKRFAEQRAANVMEVESLLETNRKLGEKIEEDEAYVKQLEDALMNLVQLKDWKDKHGKDEHYENNQPLAWEQARRIIQNKK